MIYPLLTWLVGWPSFTITVRIDGTSEVLTVTDGVAYGWQTTGAVVGLSQATLRAASAGTMAAAIATALATHTLAGPVTAYYGIRTGSAWEAVQAGSGDVGYFLDWNPAENDAVITATSDAASLALFGLRVNDAIEQTALINRRTAGVWRPKFAPPAQMEPVYSAIGSGAMSEYSPATQDRLLFGGRLIWSVMWEYVEAADITRALLDVADYLPVANRAPGDTLGTLDDVLYALAQGLVLKLALIPRGASQEDAVLYRDVVVDNPGNFSRDAYTTEAAVGARRYNVTMAFTETRDYTPETDL